MLREIVVDLFLNSHYVPFPTLWKLWLINFFISNLSLIDTFSVGYSTCHWCHVMEQESFQNEEIGRILNENFVCIKVDREERPDVDKVYMTFVQVGSWNLRENLVISRTYVKGIWSISFCFTAGNQQRRWLANECVVDSWSQTICRWNLFPTWGWNLSGWLSDCSASHPRAGMGFSIHNCNKMNESLE